MTKAQLARAEAQSCGDRPTALPSVALADLDLSLLLVKASRARLSGPQRWTRDAFARERNGNICLPDDAKASRWCLTGALLCEAAIFDGQRLCYADKHSPADLVVDTLLATPTGRLVVETIGSYFGLAFEDSGVGTCRAGHFVFAPRLAYGPRQLAVSVLPQFINDLPGLGWRWIDLYLAGIERGLHALLTAEFDRSFDGQA